MVISVIFEKKVSVEYKKTKLFKDAYSFITRELTLDQKELTTEQKAFVLERITNLKTTGTRCSIEFENKGLAIDCVVKMEQKETLIAFTNFYNKLNPDGILISGAEVELFISNGNLTTESKRNAC